MNAEIIAIGSELLTPFHLDTNSLYLTGQLEQLGIAVIRKTVVGDGLDDLQAAFSEALERTRLIIGMGGLGPTDDDRTREAISVVLDRPLEPDPEAEEWLRARFQKFNQRMAEVNLKQTLVPRGAEWIPNDNGTAPALWLTTHDEKIIILLPGPPRELEPLFATHCMPRLRKLAPRRAFAEKILKVTGIGESDLEEIVAPIYTKFTGLQTTVLSSPGEVQIHVRATAEDEGTALRRADELSVKLEEALGEKVFARGPETLEQVVGLYLMMRGATLAVAESCTGGLLGQRLTSIPGSSKYFQGGIISYTDDAKKKLLKVPAAILKAKGAVSAEAAAAMARGVRKALNAKFGLAITGIAGPAGGTPDKPVGTVFISLAENKREKTRKFLLIGDRERIRWVATQTALDMVRRRLLK